MTDGWIKAARALRTEFSDRIPTSPIEVKMNVIVTHSPHHDGDIEGHIDSTAGETIIENGHLEDPELTITVDYKTAQAAFVSRDVNTVMQAVFGGKILVVGDAAKLTLLMAQPPSEPSAEMYQRLDQITTKPDQP